MRTRQMVWLYSYIVCCVFSAQGADDIFWSGVRITDEYIAARAQQGRCLRFVIDRKPDADITDLNIYSTLFTRRLLQPERAIINTESLIPLASLSFPLIVIADNPRDALQYREGEYRVYLASISNPERKINPQDYLEIRDVQEIICSLSDRDYAPLYLRSRLNVEQVMLSFVVLGTLITAVVGYHGAQALYVKLKKKKDKKDTSCAE